MGIVRHMNSHLDILQETQTYLNEHRNESLNFIHKLVALDRKFILHSDIKDVFSLACQEDGTGALLTSPLAEMVEKCQEGVIDHACAVFAVRIRVARWLYFQIHLETLYTELINVSQYLTYKERLVSDDQEPDWTLEIDLRPFSEYSYKLHESDSIGRGVEFLNRHLSGRLFSENNKGDRLLLEFLRVLSCRCFPYTG